MNRPTVTDEIDPAVLRKKWPEFRRIIMETLPEAEALRGLLMRAGAAAEPHEANISAELLEAGLKYHPYMRRRILLTRLLPMMDFRE
jgi:hypothetical protein